MTTGANEFWEGINKDQLDPQRIEREFARFKSSPINYKLALFNPEVNGVRYLINARQVTGHVLVVDAGQRLMGMGNTPIAAND